MGDVQYIQYLSVREALRIIEQAIQFLLTLWDYCHVLVFRDADRPGKA